MRFRLTITCVLITFAACSHPRATVVVSNRTGADLCSVRVGLSSDKHWRDIDTLRTGASTEISFANYADAHYLVSCISQKGKRLSFEAGYITNGMSFRDSLTFIVDTLSTVRLSYVSSPAK